jgi:copper transport protein
MRRSPTPTAVRFAQRCMAVGWQSSRRSPCLSACNAGTSASSGSRPSSGSAAVRVDALSTTAYGRVLWAKLALASVLLAIALWNRLHLMPRIAAGADGAWARLRSSIIAELVVVVVGVVGLWRFTPRPRALAGGNDDFFTHLHADKVMANVTVSPGHAGPIDITVALETPDERPLEAGALEVTLSKPDAGIEPAVAQARRTADGQWRVSVAAPVAGQWTLALGVLISDFERVNVAVPILIK